MRGSGLTPTESRVMALWESGRSLEQIAEATGFASRKVGRIVSSFDVNGPEDRRREASIRAGCARYAAALTATGKVYA